MLCSKFHQKFIPEFHFNDFFLTQKATEDRNSSHKSEVNSGITSCFPAFPAQLENFSISTLPPPFPQTLPSPASDGWEDEEMLTRINVDFLFSRAPR